MIYEDKETGRFFLVKEVDRSSFFDGTVSINKSKDLICISN